MSHSFKLTLADEISSVLTRVESHIADSGGSFNGTVERGVFEGKSLLGMIRGEYACVSPEEIIVTITHKPFAVPYSIIESEIRKYFT